MTTAAPRDTINRNTARGRQNDDGDDDDDDDDDDTRWFKYDRDYLCMNKSQFVPVIFEPPCKYDTKYYLSNTKNFSLQPSAS